MVTTILLVGLASLVADFGQVRSFGLLSDDWALLGNLVWNESDPPGRIIHDLCFYSWEARPLRAVEYALQWCAWRIAGLPGAFLLLWLCLTASGVLFAQLTRRRLPDRLALIAGLLFVLFPADTTHIWSATLMAKLGLLYAMISAWCFVRHRHAWAGLFALAAVASYELSIFPLVLLPWWQDGGSRRSIVRGTLVAGSALLLYAAWRYFVFPQFVPDTRILAVRDDEGGLVAIVRQWATTSLFAIRDLGVWWPWSALRVAWRPENRAILLAAVAVFLPAFLLLDRRRGPTKLSIRGAAVALAFGLLGISAGCALAVRATPAATFGIFSRHNLAAAVGACLALTVLIGAAISWPKKAWTRAVFLALTSVLLASFVAFRVAVQDGYVAAARYQEGVLRDLVADLGPLPPHTVVIIRQPRRDWSPRVPDVIRPFVSGQIFESEAMFKLIYDDSIIAVAIETDADLKDAYTITAVAQLAREIKRPFHRVAIYTVPDRTIEWMRVRPLEANEKLIEPSGPAWDHVVRWSDDR
ncbi:MAG: hypothetical protein KDB53_06435 [Planctomycetes bacterium]|nr:hypothetical protein [Planctomycetota bacterium]